MERNINYRLQLLNHGEIFTSREEAIEYMNDSFRMDALIGEPAIAYYGSEKEPKAVIALGTPTLKRIFIIDTYELKETLEKYQEKIDKDDDNIDKLINNVNDIIKATGLTYDENKIQNKVTFEVDAKDTIIGDAKSLSESVFKLSEFIKDNFLTVKESSTVKLNYDEINDGKELSADVKISSEGEDDDVLFNDNIVGIKPDGLFASVNLYYDEDQHQLVFTTSGFKNGKFVTDAKRKLINLGEHTEISEGNTDVSPIKIKVTEKDKKTVIGADVKLSEEDNNILKVQDGALMVEGTSKNIKYKDTNVFKGINNVEKKIDILSELDVQVNIFTNELTVTVGENSKTVELPGVNIIDSVQYDKVLHQLVLNFKNGSSATIPLDDLFKETHFVNSSDIELHEHVNEDGSSDVFGNVIISSREDNVLQKDETGLFVKSSEVGVSLRDVQDEVKKEEERAKSVESELEKMIDGVINTITLEVSNREHEFENLNNKLDSEIARVTVYTDSKVKEEEERAKESELVNSTDILNEKSRATLAESELRSSIEIATSTADTAKATVETVKTDLNSEILRAHDKESELDSGVKANATAIENEAAARSEADARHESGIESNRVALEQLQGTVEVTGSIRNIISDESTKITQKIEIEKTRAEGAENVINERIDNIVNTNLNNLNEAKAYTDLETERAKSVEEGIKNSILSLEDKDSELSQELVKKIENVELAPVEGQPFTYQLLVDGQIVSTLNIPSPENSYFKDAVFSSDTNLLTITFVNNEGEKTVDVDMSKLMNIYGAGLGLGLDKDSNFYIFKNEEGDEGYLKIDKNGICVNGINAELNKKANIEDVYNKTESDIEHEKVISKINDSENKITSKLTDAKISLEGQINTVAQSVSDETTRATNAEQLIENNFLAHKNESDNSFVLVNEKIAAVETVSSNNASAIVNEKSRAELSEQNLSNRLDNAETAISVLNSGIGIEGSVSDKIHQAQLFIEEKIVNEKSRAEVAETQLQTNIDVVNQSVDNKIETAKEIINLRIDNEVDKLSVRLTGDENDISALQDAVGKKIETIQLVKAEGDLSYTLMVDNQSIGEINIPRINLLVDAQYSNGNLILVFKVNDTQQQTITIPLTEYIKPYNAGDGLVLNENTFSVIRNSESENYLSVSESGIGIFGINNAIKESADELKELISSSSIEVDGAEVGNPIKLSKSVVDNKTVLSARIDISNAEHNLLLNNNGTLYADGNATAHYCIGADGEVSNVQKELTNIYKSVNDAVIIVDDVKSLKSSAETLQSDMLGLKNDMISLNGNVGTYDSKIANMEAKVNTFDNRIANLETSVEDLKTAIGDDNIEDSLMGRLKNIETLLTEISNFGTYFTE